MKSLSHVQLFETPWTVAHQAPLSMGFPRQEHWTRLPFPSPGYLPDPGIEPRSPASQADSSPFEPPGNPCCLFIQPLIKKILRLPCVMVFPQLKKKEHLNIQDLLLRCLPVMRVVIISSYHTSWLLEAFTPKQLSPRYIHSQWLFMTHLGLSCSLKSYLHLLWWPHLAKAAPEDNMAGILR